MSPAERPSNIGWIFSARTDILSFTLPAVLALGWIGLSPQARDSSDSPLWLWGVGVLLVDVAHVWATAFVTYLDPLEWRNNCARYVMIPFGGWVAGVAVYSLGGPAVFWTSLAYLAVFHFVRQQAGWMSLYRARAGDRSRAGLWIDTAAIYGATLYPLLWWHCNLPRGFHWMLPGDFVAGLPGEASAVAGGVYAAALSAYLGRALWHRWSGECTQWGKHLLLTSTGATWYVGVVGTNSDYAFTLANVFTHGIPYAVLVFVYARHRLQAQQETHPGSGRLLSGSPAQAGLRFLACLWVAAFVEELLWDRAVWHEHSKLFGDPWEASSLHALLVPLLAVPQLTHYLVDGLLWRRSQNPGLSQFFHRSAS